MRTKLIAVALSAAVVLSAPGAAFAGKRDNARTSIAAAKAKIDLNEKNGVTGAAADMQSRARTALEEAQHQFDKSQENAAISAAKQADALAELASTTQANQVAAHQEAAVTQPTLATQTPQP